MLNYILTSISIAPILVGVIAAKGRDGTRDRSALRLAWVVYAVTWFALVYFIGHRWG